MSPAAYILFETHEHKLKTAPKSVMIKKTAASERKWDAKENKKYQYPGIDFSSDRHIGLSPGKGLYFRQQSASDLYRCHHNHCVYPSHRRSCLFPVSARWFRYQRFPYETRITERCKAEFSGIYCWCVWKKRGCF